MWLRGRLLATFLLYFYFVSGDFQFPKRKGKQIYGILDYFQNQQSEQITHLQIPLLILPVIIVPSMINFQENVTTNKVNTEEIQEDVTSTNTPTGKIVVSTESFNDVDDIEINFRQSLNRGTKVPKREVIESEQTVEQNYDILNKTRHVSNTNELDLNNSSIDFGETKEKTTNGTIIFNDHNNIFPENTYTGISETFMPIGTNDESTVLHDSDDDWKTSTEITNLFIVKENKTSLSEHSNSSVNGTNANEGAYTAPLYNNTMIDQVSIATNSYTNLESPPTQHDRWKTFSSLKRGPLKPTGFKPLAGLYYDGFLHSPLIKMPGFIPYQ